MWCMDGLLQAGGTGDHSGASAPVEIVGRRASLFTRVALLFAETLRVPYRLTHIADMAGLDASTYGGNPALRMPILRRGGEVVWGTENICRALGALAALRGPVRVIWPEDLRDPLARNAQELVWQCMASQVQVVMGTVIGGLPAENIFFVKARTGMEASLRWLDGNLDALLRALPEGRDISLLETTLFCLIEHLSFRPAVSVAEHARLNDFAATFGEREAARATAYRFQQRESSC